MIYTNDNVTAILELILKDARQKKLDAAMGGERHDGGARVL